MSGRQQEAEQQQMLLMVETAQRAGGSEGEIAELIDEAVGAETARR
jgi:hypothetical protein